MSWKGSSGLHNQFYVSGGRSGTGCWHPCLGTAFQIGMLGAQLFRLSVLYRDKPSPALAVECSSTFMDQLKAKASSKCFCFKGSLVKEKWVK